MNNYLPRPSNQLGPNFRIGAARQTFRRHSQALPAIPWRAIRALLASFLSVFPVGSVAVWAEGDVAARIAPITETARYRESHWGAVFVDQATGEEVYEKNQDKLFAPASVAKAFSVAAALDGLGADFCFETTVVRRGEVDPLGTLAGDLVLIASGDLTLGGRTTETGEIAFSRSDHTYAAYFDDATLTAPDPLAGLNSLANQVAAAGIKRIAGRVLIDDRLFERDEGSGSGPSITTPIIVNDNVIDFLIEPTTNGQLARVTWRPQTTLWTVESKIETSVGASATAIAIREQGRILTLTGKIAEGRAPFTQIFEVPDPTEFARCLFAEALRRASIATPGAENPGSGAAQAILPPRETTLALPRVALLRSPPFAENIRLILKVSHNLHANILPYLLAAKNGQRTLADGLSRERDFLIKVGVDADSIALNGGSGGTRSDFVTPAATVKLLRAMCKRRDFEVYRRGLPIMGVDGTLAQTVPIDSPIRGQVHAKTGTLTWFNGLRGQPLVLSKTLAGYLTTRSGRQLVFALFVNNVHARPGFGSKEIGEDLAKVCEVLYEVK